MQPTQIIAMGGGGFSMEPENPLLDNYIVAACGKPDPVVTFVPTASGDSDYLITKFYDAFAQLPCRPRHLPLFRQPRDLERRVLGSDALYVGGGNTRNMLAVWRAAGVDTLLREALARGVVLSGLSAGAICWFEEGHTDSTGALGRLDCLALLKGSCSPHYDGEPERRPSYHRHILDGALQPGLALDDGVAAHFIDGELSRLVSSRPHSRAFFVSKSGDEIHESPLDIEFLGK